MKAHRAWVFAVLAATALVTVAPRSRADTDDDAQKRASDAVRDDASARFNRGLALFAEDNFVAALVEFRKAYDLTKNYKVLYNIGQVCFQMQDYVCALESLEAYSAAGRGEIPEDRAAEVARDMATLRSRIGRLTITTSVAGVDVAIDDVRRGTTPLAAPIALSAGRHRVLATKRGMNAETRFVEVAGTESVTLDIVMIVAPTQREIVVRPETPSRWTTWSWIGAGSALALGIGAAVTGAFALSASKDLQGTDYVMTPSADATSLRSRVKTLALTSDILTVAALGTLGTTLVLTYTRTPRTESPRPNVALDLTLGGVMLRGAFP
jgi:hypothetical protein